MKREKEVVGFHFQTIPLEEAKAIALAGTGNYSDLTVTILESIPTLKPDESFAFGLPKGELPEDQRRGICKALNQKLKQAGHSLKVTYSTSRKLFVLYPYQRKVTTSNGASFIPKSKFNDPTIGEKVWELRNQGMKRAAIVKKLHIPLESANYHLYKKKPADPAKNLTEPFEHLIDTATKLWQVPENQLKDRHNNATRSMRKAVQFMAYKDLKVKRELIANCFGLSIDAIWFNATHMKSKDMELVNQLRKAL